MKKAHLLAQKAAVSVSLNLLKAVHFSWKTWVRLMVGREGEFNAFYDWSELITLLLLTVSGEY